MINHMDLQRAEWRKSSRSSGGSDNCVEVALLPHVIGIRDTKDRDGGMLVVPDTSWRVFSAMLRDDQR